MARRMGPFASPGRFSSRGLFYSYEREPGVHVVAAWPRKSKAKPTELQRLYRKLMGGVQRSARYRLDIEQVAAEEFQKGSPYLRKDCLIAAAWGTMIEAYTLNGDRITGVRVLASEIQAMLDTITDVTGSMLMRTNQGWRPLYPVQVGRVLTDKGPGNVPAWEMPTAPAATNDSEVIYGVTGEQGDAKPTLGFLATIRAGVAIKSATAAFFAATATTVQASLWTVSGGKLDTLQAQSLVEPVSAGTGNMVKFTFGSLYVPTGEQSIAVVFYQPGTGSGDKLPIGYIDYQPTAPAFTVGPNHIELSEAPASGVSYSTYNHYPKVAAIGFTIP